MGSGYPSLNVVFILETGGEWAEGGFKKVKWIQNTLHIYTIWFTERWNKAEIQKCMRAQLLCGVWLFVTPWTIPSRLLCPWNFPGKNSGVGLLFPSPGDPPTQGSNPHLLHWQADPLSLCHLDSHIEGTRQDWKKKLFIKSLIDCLFVFWGGLCWWLSMQGAWVQSLVRPLRSRMSHGEAK